MSTVCEKKFNCEICSVKFRHNCKLTEHKNQVHGNIKKFECHMCNKKFGVRSTLARHVKTVHYGEKEHECQICAKRYFTSQLLKYHYIVKEENMNAKCVQRPCQVCII